MRSAVLAIVFSVVTIAQAVAHVRGVTPEPFGSRPSVIERGDDRSWKVVSD